MPLIKGKSKKAFSENVKTEMHAGKPQKQSLAIAYAMKRKAPKKMAEGGQVDGKTLGESIGYPGSKPAPKPSDEAIKKENYMAEGGQITRRPHSLPSPLPAGDEQDIFHDEDYKEAPMRESEQLPEHKATMLISKEKKAYGGIAGDSMTNHLRDDEEHEMSLDSPEHDGETSPWYEEEDEDHTSPQHPSNDPISIADHIINKRHKMAKGGMAHKMAHGGEVDNNARESGQTPYDPMNARAHDEPVYDVTQLDAQPKDSNEHGDSIDSDIHDHIEIIRRKLKAKREA